MSSSSESPEPPDSPDAARGFTFVAGSDTHVARSRAIRAHWQQRRQRIDARRLEREEQARRPLRTLLPGASSGAASITEAVPVAQTSRAAGPVPDDPAQQQASLSEGRAEPHEGIPGQALAGMNLALGTSRLDPFDSHPVKLTPQIHRLLHHWLATFAGMVFAPQVAHFNPMRDVWFPLDFSNAASFNAVIAHSAAHLARMQGCPVSAEAARYKLEAVRIVRLWAQDHRAKSDDIIAAILRLSSYERYYGSEAEWHIHHDGLLWILESRGGIASLEAHWQLEIATYLATLMKRPSWFHSSNLLGDISQQPLVNHPVLGEAELLHRTRSIWVLSLLQDLRTLMLVSSEAGDDGLTHYASIKTALALLQSDLHESEVAEQGLSRLACLFYVTMVLQATIEGRNRTSASAGSALQYNNLTLSSLNEMLSQGRSRWETSVPNLYRYVFGDEMASDNPPGARSYASNLAQVLQSTSPQALQGVERCMLQILNKALVDTRSMIDYEWTPDNLLASTVI